jgi:hypothetical protein
MTGRRWTGGLMAATAAAVLALGVSAASAADDPAADGKRTVPIETDSFDYLISEPATLLDIGLMKMRMDVKAAARRLYDGGLAAREPLAGAYYDFRAKGLTLYVSVRETLAPPSAAKCVETFAHVQRSVLGTHPKGPNQAGHYLAGIFGHEFFPRWGRPPTLIKDLLDTTRLEIVILPADPMQGGKKVACSGTLDAQAEDLEMEAAT